MSEMHLDMKTIGEPGMSDCNSSTALHTTKWLDVGCGGNKLAGAVGIDQIALPGVDVVHDLEAYPWPFPDNTFDRIVCRHSLSHLTNLVRAMEEIHRVTRPGGTVDILAPHYASDNFNTDPTHKIHIGYRSMNYFCDNIPFKYHYYTNYRFALVERAISFRECRTDFREKVALNPFRWVGIEQLINAFPRLYERFFV